MSLIVILLPIFDMRKNLKEHKGYLFLIGKIVDKEITL